MKCLVLLLVTLTWLTLSSAQVLACTCGEYGTPVCASYWRSDAVFVGHLRDITPQPRSANIWPSVTLHFIVEQPFRGITTATVEVGTPFGTTCDMGFVKGKRYLIYAYRDSESNQLLTGPCSRTSELEHAVDDLNYIRSLAQQGVKESIAGRVERMKYMPVRGVKIEVLNDKKSFETRTDEKGDYSVSLPGPGTYTVRVLIAAAVSVLSSRADLNDKYETTETLTTMEYKVELGKRQCDYRQLDLFPIDVHATAKVSGTVLTASSRPVNNGYVHLIKGKESDRWTHTRTNADGSFLFEGVAAGEYFLVLNADNEAPGKDDPPYARAFYPDATDECGARKIVVTEGAVLENLTLRVGPALRARTVSGRVVWLDGRAAANAHLFVYNGDRYVRTINADKKGRFTLKVYDDFKYAIEAKGRGEPTGESARILITNKSIDLTLILKSN